MSDRYHMRDVKGLQKIEWFNGSELACWCAVCFVLGFIGGISLLIALSVGAP